MSAVSQTAADQPAGNRRGDRYPIADAQVSDAHYIAAHLRTADRDEIIATIGQGDVAAAIQQSLATSSCARCAMAPRSGGLAPAVIWGVTPASYLSATGVPWMVATPALETHWRAFLRRCRPELEQMSVGFRTLRNHVDARNRVAIRWLTWLGFDIEPARPYGPHKLPFHEFSIIVKPPLPDIAAPSDDQPDDHG